MKCPCMNCKKRQLGCHAKCKDYQAYTEYLKKVRDMERLDKCTSTSSGWSYTNKRKREYV